MKKIIEVLPKIHTRVVSPEMMRKRRAKAWVYECGDGWCIDILEQKTMDEEFEILKDILSEWYLKWSTRGGGATLEDDGIGQEKS